MNVAHEVAAYAPDIRQVLLEATALGCWFRLSGNAVLVSGEPPEPTMRVLRQCRQELWQLFGGPALDQPAIDLLKQLEVEPVLIDTCMAASKAVADLRAHSGPFGIDIETTPSVGEPLGVVKILKDGRIGRGKKESSPEALDPHRAAIATVQVYAGSNICYVFRGAGIADELKTLILAAPLVIHNAAFELKFFKHYWGAFPQKFHCTMQAIGLLQGAHKRGLDDAASIYLGIDVPKDLATSDWGAAELSPGQFCYAAADAVLTYRLWPKLASELKQKGRDKAYQLQRNVIVPTVDMELRGITVDVQAHAEHKQRWALELADARRAFTDATGRTPPKTPEEIRDFLRVTLSAEELQQWPLTEKTEKLSTARGQLLHYGHVASIRNLVDILRREKLLSVFGTKLVGMTSNGRIHAHFNVAGAKSGRFTCSAPNMQQLPSARDPKFKTCFAATPGHVLVACDFNQIEMRAAAWISGDEELTAVYAEGRDLHRENAAAIVGCNDPAYVTAEQRNAAKPVGFGAIYGIGPASLCATAWESYGIEMTLEEAGQALSSFFAKYPTFKRWMRSWSNRCQCRGLVPIGCGRIIDAAWEADGELTYNLAINAPVQGICADALMRSMVNVYASMQASGIDGGLALTVHDELILEVPETSADAAAKILHDSMLNAFVATFPGAPTRGVVEVKTGKNWAAMK